MTLDLNPERKCDCWSSVWGWNRINQMCDLHWSPAKAFKSPSHRRSSKLLVSFISQQTVDNVISADKRPVCRNILLLDLQISPLGFALAWVPLSDFMKMFKSGIGPHSITLEHQESLAVLIPSTEADHFLVRPYTIYRKGSSRLTKSFLSSNK